MEIRNAIYKDRSNICAIKSPNTEAMCQIPLNKQKGKYTNYVYLANSNDPIYKSGLYYWDTSDKCNCLFKTINNIDYIFVSTDILYKVN